MAPLTYTLIALKKDVAEATFTSALQKFSPKDRPLFIGKCQHWVHAPHLSASALQGTESGGIKKWDYLLVSQPPTNPSNLNNVLPDSIKSLATETWTISANGLEAYLTDFSQQKADRFTAPVPNLPSGWSPDNHSGLDAAVPPLDLEASLALSAHPLGSSSADVKHKDPVVLKDFIRTFGTHHNAPIAMFNLLSYMPGQRPRYLEYIAAFIKSVGSKYGGAPIFASDGVYDWSSKENEKAKGQDGEWEDTALVAYPSIWHFGKMLDDEEYADADRRYKQGAVRDNAILCVTELEIE